MNQTWALVIEGAAAVYIVWISAIMSTPNLFSAFIFKAIPLSLGVILGFVTIARYMGWPIF